MISSGGPPSEKQLEAELARVRYQQRYRTVLRSTICTLIVVAAVAVLVATIWMPVLQIYGSSMTPTLSEGDIVVCFKTSDIKRGDLVAFYLGNKLLVKRCVAMPGQTVDIDFTLGRVFVDGELLQEDYVNDLTYLDEGTQFPLTLGEGELFLMGDNRNRSSDSRDERLGAVDERLIIGKAVLLVFPGRDSLTDKRDFSRLGSLKMK